MIDVNHYQIGNVKVKISSDIVLPATKSMLYEKFLAPPGDANARYSIFELETKSYTLSPLDQEEKKALRRTLVFPEWWLANPVFRAPAVREAIQYCRIEPELFHLSLSWNRLIIRNFAENEFHFFYYPENKKDMTDPVFNARLRNLISLAMVNDLSFLLHGAGVMRQNGAALFLAPDAGGKTTLIKKFKRNEILSDDQVVVRWAKNTFHLCSTPFGTMSCGPAKSELAGIFIIKKSKKFKILPAKANDTLRFIWNESFLKTVVLPKVLRTRVFDMLYQLCRQIPSYYIHTPIDSLDFKAIDNALAGKSNKSGS
ncbi:MAG: hypothetical protein JXI33_01480 [Candidatus Aminicenantes bacterium]|nr:hypothetical protein [Candidatus Aminicenantes bacterium]